MSNPELCDLCGAGIAREWVPAIFCAERPLAGTGLWRSQLVDGRCPTCRDQLERRAEEQRSLLRERLRLVALGGGDKPHREFHFESFQVVPENQAAFTRAREFNPDRDNLYLWGACGVGKTHLAFAAARGHCLPTRSVEFVQPPKLLRRVRRRDPDEEQQAINRFISADVFVLDDLGIGHETAYARQIFQEILDGRDNNYRAGLIVTSRYSLDDLALKLGEDTIPSRLGGTCRVIQVSGIDHRLSR